VALYDFDKVGEQFIIIVAFSMSFAIEGNGTARVRTKASIFVDVGEMLATSLTGCLGLEGNRSGMFFPTFRTV
jgi:hypothetical protein